LTEIPSEVLAEAFQSVIQNRRLRSAVFLTFRFDPGFFEREVLPAFFDIPLSQVPELRVLNLSEAIREIDALAVYYDRRALEVGAASGKLDVQRIAVSHPTGYFHPKNVLALVENDHSVDGGPPSLSLIVCALSANLTRAGWWENVEIAHIEEIQEGAICSFRDDLLLLIQRLRRSAPQVQRHEALDRIHAFVRKLQPESQRMRNGVVLPRFFSGGSIVDFLKEVAGNRLQKTNLEILSPYFDDTASPAGPLEALGRAFNLNEVRVYLPRGLENEALCTRQFYEEIKKSAQWGSLPDAMMRLSKSAWRTLHAKSYRFFDRDRGYEAFFVGSANLTNAAFGNGGNVESGFFVESSQPTRKQLDWWLVTDTASPTTFLQRAEDDDLLQGDGWKLSLEYDWHAGSSRCYWDDSHESSPLTLLAHGVELATIPALACREWVLGPAALTLALAESLKTSSFVTVRIGDSGAEAQILVNETNMTHKPSLMATLSAADILRYWSLLTPDQKNEFLEERAQELVSDPEIAMWLAAERRPMVTDTFFTTFAEVFLSFGNLERTVRAALVAKREREAVDRLFGRKFDSMRRLIERVLEEADADAVRGYISLLCAQQLLDTVKRDYADFLAAYSQDSDELHELLARAGELRTKLDLGSEPETFFKWFDRWFIQRAEPTMVESQ
jgi:hypothetical protein